MRRAVNYGAHWTICGACALTLALAWPGQLGAD